MPAAILKLSQLLLSPQLRAVRSRSRKIKCLLSNADDATFHECVGRRLIAASFSYDARRMLFTPDISWIDEVQ